MIKQIDIHGQRVKLYSLDEGRTLVEQSAIHRCLWAKAASVARRIKESV